MSSDLLHAINPESLAKRQKQTNFVINLGLLSNAFLALVKISAGFLGHSTALLADGINSVSDVVYLVFVKILMKLSDKPADDEHPYGHHQFESIAAVVIGAFVITTGIALFWDSLNTAFDLLSGASENKPVRFFALIVAISTIVIKLFLMFNAASVSRKTGNIAVAALSRDHRNDIFASLGAAVGISLGLLGYQWVDPLAGALVAIIVAKTGIDILRESTSELMDTLPSNEMEEKIRQIMKAVVEVKNIEGIHVHKFGPYYMVNVIIGIDGDLSVAQGDKIADSVEQMLYNEIELLKRVYIHYHPANIKKNQGSDILAGN